MFYLAVFKYAIRHQENFIKGLLLAKYSNNKCCNRIENSYLYIDVRNFSSVVQKKTKSIKFYDN